jgi:hypothetical protein
MSIARGEMQQGIQAWTDANGPLDVLAFDACNMAAWEVAHAFGGLASFMTASESTVGMSGYQYDLTLASLRDNPDWGAAELATDLALQATEGGEWTQSAIDLGAVPPLSTAIDELAVAVLADDRLMEPLLQARDASQGTDHTYNEWYMDLGSLATNLQASDQPALSDAGLAIEQALDEAVIGNFTGGPYTFATGLNILFDTRWASHLTTYSEGRGASWSEDTHWDDLLLAISER